MIYSLYQNVGNRKKNLDISKYKDFFSEIVVGAVEHLEDDLDKSYIGIKKVTGGSVTDSFLVEGVAFKKTFSYAGFE